MCNIEVRNAAKDSGIRLWQVADEIGMNESVLSRKLRKELPDAEKARLLDAIRRLARRKQEAD